MPFDKEHWAEVLRNIIIFLKTYVVKVLLGIRPLEFCPSCDKVCLELDEMGDDGKSSISCMVCSMRFHLTCAGVTSSEDTEEWMCKFCKDVASMF